jgi:pimeloyl-ACP methyl ester carboxylesterase
VEGGAEKVKADGTGFARAQWKTWSSPAWFDAVEFEHTAKSFTNPDWVAITLNVYRSRWREGEAWDSRYDPLQQRLHQVEKLAIPTLIIQGNADTCDAPSESEGQDAYFTGGYQRVLLDGVGHFPHREAADAISARPPSPPARGAVKDWDRPQPANFSTRSRLGHPAAALALKTHGGALS